MLNFYTLLYLTCNLTVEKIEFDELLNVYYKRRKKVISYLRMKFYTFLTLLNCATGLSTTNRFHDALLRYKEIFIKTRKRDLPWIWPVGHCVEPYKRNSMKRTTPWWPGPGRVDPIFLVQKSILLPLIIPL